MVGPEVLRRSAGFWIDLPVKYHVLTTTNPSSLVSVARIRAQHELLNASFSARNTDIDKIPSSGKYSVFRNTVGNPSIRFLPLDHNQITEESQIVNYYDAGSATFNSDSPLLEAIELMESLSYPLPEGFINIIVAPISTLILGEAFLFGPTTIVRSGAVGGPGALGTYGSFRLGRTLVHEMGHVAGLQHTFKTNGCTGAHDITDIPRQKNPNSNPSLVLSEGEWVASDCNRDADCKANLVDRSCVSLSACGTGTNEAENIFSYMDYSPDAVMNHFSEEQARRMRENFLSDEIIFPFKILTPKEIDPTEEEELPHRASTALIIPIVAPGALERIMPVSGTEPKIPTNIMAVSISFMIIGFLACVLASVSIWSSYTSQQVQQ